jgi:hypothetical protein
MPLLKDYLGSLVSGINQARAMADIESAKIAELYASNEILKNFSVPRFRAQDIELNIPIAIDALDEQEPVDYQPIDNIRFNSLVYHTIKDQLKTTKIDRKKSDLLRKEIAKSTQTLEINLKAKEDKTISLQNFSNQLSQKVIKIAQLEGNEPNEEVIKKLQKSLQEQLNPEIKEPVRSIDPDKTKIIVESGKLKDYNPQSITHIKIKLVEEGMEWQSIEKEDGKTDQRLLPE